MWAAETKAAMLRHNDRLVPVDGYGSTEAFGVAVDITTAAQRRTTTGRFVASSTTKVLADGTIKLLGRGSQCINTGGEKVFPEEVEEALKSHPSVADAAVVGVPDDRFGQAIIALVEPTAEQQVDESTLITHVKSLLAGYKAPKRVLQMPSVGRAANGKLDYRRLTEVAVTAGATAR